MTYDSELPLEAVLHVLKLLPRDGEGKYANNERRTCNTTRTAGSGSF
jgi:hypothetical protein